MSDYYRVMWYSIVMNTVDSILRIIDIEEGTTIVLDILKTMNPYISGLAIVESRSL